MFYAGQSPESDSDKSSFLSFEKISYPSVIRKSRYNEAKHMKYKVESDDTLASIAVKFCMTTFELRHLNHLLSDNVFVNQELVVNRCCQENLAHSCNIPDPRVESRSFSDRDNVIQDMGLLPFQSDMNYLKITVKYVTDQEGHIKGNLLLTPYAISFIPTLLDPAVVETDSNRFSVHLPNNKIGAFYMYNNGDVMLSNRPQRAKMSTSLITPYSISEMSSSATLTTNACDTPSCSNLEISPDTIDPFDAFNTGDMASNTGEVAANPDESIQRCDTAVDIVNCSKESLLDLEQFGRRRSLKKQQYDMGDLDMSLSETLSSGTSGDQSSHPVNYLCIVASPRFKKIKNTQQKSDEYWFMVPVSKTQSIMEYLLENAETKLSIGEEIDCSTNWTEDLAEESASIKTADDLAEESKDVVQSDIEIVHQHFANNITNGSNGNGNSKLSRMHSQRSTTSIGNRRKSFARIDDAIRGVSSGSSEFGLVRVSKDGLSSKGSSGDKNTFGSFLEWEIVNIDKSSEEPILDHGMGSSAILNEDQIQNILLSIQSISVGEVWELVYSTDRDGWSLSTLYRNVFDMTRNACFLLIKDFKRNVFGAFCSHYIHMSEHFYGNGESFVFRWNPEFEKFTFSGKNYYFLNGDVSYFSVGCSDARHSIRITSDLQFGRTQACDTFDSPALVASEDFRIANLEVWSFY